jgi:hypothetical protein
MSATTLLPLGRKTPLGTGAARSIVREIPLTF